MTLRSRAGRAGAALGLLLVTSIGVGLALLSPVPVAAVTAIVPLISIGDTWARVPTSGTSSATFTVSLSQASTNAVGVLYATHDMTATVAAGDYAAASGTVLFSPGTMSQTFNVTVNADTTGETAEGFTVSLTSPVNGTLNNAVGTARLLALGRPPLSASAVGAVVNEPAHGVAKEVFSVMVAPKPTGAQQALVSYVTADGTATAAHSDYVPVFGQLTFNASSSTVQTVSVSVLPDAAAQGILTFFLDVSTSSHGAAMVEGEVQGYIVASGSRPPPTPIKHIVIIDQENHSFDNVLGRFCAATLRCDGATTGKLPNGTTIPLSTATDVVPSVGHGVSDMRKAIDGGKMDGFAKLAGCGSPTYACYSQFDTSQIPNLVALAQKFSLSDRTFELNQTPSFGSHLELVAATLDGFTGDNPAGLGSTGWGCDSQLLAPWGTRDVPSCVPLPNGMGPYAPSPVKWVPTIMDRLDSAGLSWHIYAAAGGTDLGYSWAICPTFADCIFTKQSQNLVPAAQMVNDAQAGALPAFSIVTPVGENSQHNLYSMAQGDNWIGSIMSAIQAGPDWSSTAVFITYDDCGCFYDHVAPSGGMGVRVPMVIVSPFARAGFTDSTVASYTSLMAYVEHVFGLAPLGPQDQTAYDYHRSFDYAQTPLGPTTFVTSPLPPSSQNLAGPTNDGDS